MWHKSDSYPRSSELDCSELEIVSKVNPRLGMRRPGATRTGAGNATFDDSTITGGCCSVGDRPVGPADKSSGRRLFGPAPDLRKRPKLSVVTDRRQRGRRVGHWKFGARRGSWGPCAPGSDGRGLPLYRARRLVRRLARRRHIVPGQGQSRLLRGRSALVRLNRPIDFKDRFPARRFAAPIACWL